MERYISASGKQYGATAYELAEDWIIIEFQHKTHYKYSFSSCGPAHVNAMKALALRQQGLSTYVAQHKPAFEWKH